MRLSPGGPRRGSHLLALTLSMLLAMGVVTAAAEEPAEVPAGATDEAAPAEPLAQEPSEPSERAPVDVTPAPASVPPPPTVELTPTDPPHVGDRFGSAVAVSGNTVVVGAPGDNEGAGSVTVFVVGDPSDQQGPPLSLGTDPIGFGTAVAINGNVIAVGAPEGDGEGAGGVVAVFDQTAGVWTNTQVLGTPGSETGFGSAIALGDGWLVIGAPGEDIGEDGVYTDAGAVHVYQLGESGWAFFQELTGLDYTGPGEGLCTSNCGFGTSVDIDGTMIVVGAPGDEQRSFYEEPPVGAVFVFVFDGESWVAQLKLVDDELPGLGGAVAIDDGVIVAGGATYDGPGDHLSAFSAADGALFQRITPSDPGAGPVGSLALDNGTLAFGTAAYTDGPTTYAVEVQKLTGGQFVSEATIADPTSGSVHEFGTALGLDGGLLAIGAPEKIQPQREVARGAGGAPGKILVAQVGAPPAVNPQNPPPSGSPSGGGAGPSGAGQAAGDAGGKAAPGKSDDPSGPPQTVTVQPEPVETVEPKTTPGEPSDNGPQKPDKAAAAAGSGAAPPAGEPEERSAVSGNLLSPDEVNLSAKSLGTAGLAALLLIASLGLPITIFNETTQKNAEVFDAWLEKPGAWFASLTGRLSGGGSPLLALLGTTVVGGVLYAFVDPAFPTESGAVYILLGMLIGLGVVSFVFFGTWVYVINRLEPDKKGHWRLFWPFILMGGALVLASRVLSFLPGLILGTVADYEPSGKLSVRTAGIRVAAKYGAVAAVGVLAWFAWMPINGEAAQPGASGPLLVLDSALAIIFVSGLESMIFGLLPIQFLDGPKLLEWNKPLFWLMWGSGIFWFCLVILNPAMGSYESLGGTALVVFGALFAGLMVLAIGTWLYFRRRANRLAATQAA